MNDSTDDAVGDINSKYIQFVVEGAISGKIHFRASDLTPMRDIKHFYSVLVGIPISSLRFFYHCVQIDDADTPENLGMRDDDEIHALDDEQSYFNERIFCGFGGASRCCNTFGGDTKFSPPLMEILPQGNDEFKFTLTYSRKSMKLMHSSSQNFGNQKRPGFMKDSEVDDANDDEYIQFKVCKQDSDAIHFRVSPSISLGEMKRSYSEHIGIPITSLRFFFNGRQISDVDTPKQLRMKNGDEIRAVSNEESFINYRMRCCDRIEECLILFPSCIQFVQWTPEIVSKQLRDNEYESTFSINYKKSFTPSSSSMADQKRCFRPLVFKSVVMIDSHPD